MIHLGFEVGSGSPIQIPLRHVVITGMTQLSGKTTTIEGLIKRSNLKSIAFKTKRGEIGFEDARQIPIFFRERSDWRYVESLIEATLTERIRWERSWVINACKGANSLKEVYQNITSMLGREKLRDLDRSVYTKLQAYLDLVIPQISQLKLTNKLEITQGANVMNLVGLSVEIQSLVLRSVIDEVNGKERDCIIVLPEAWKFIPQDRGNPAKWSVEHLIREGAGIGNYLWMDSQDLRGIDKKYLRQVDVWILGRQRDPREVEATLDVIPLEKSLKPKGNDIMTLNIGHFIVCYGNEVKIIYAQPAWMPDDIAIAVAKGESKVEDVQQYKANFTIKYTPDVIAPDLPDRVSIDERNQRIQKLWEKALALEELLRE